MPRMVGFVSRGCVAIVMARLLGASAQTEASWQKVAEAAMAAGYCTQNYDISQITQASTDYPQKWVEAHNHYRGCHGSPAVIWDPTLASYARAWAEVVAAHCDGVMDVGSFVRSSGLEPHDPESYNQAPSNAENIAVFETPAMNIVQFDEATTVESWYREVESQCPDKGLTPGCGAIINHFAAVVWKQNYKIGCYSAVRGSFKVVSCRYASASPTGIGTQGCDNAGGGAQCASVGPPEPQVPALVNGVSCPRHGGLPGLQHGIGMNLPNGGKMVPIGVVLWGWLKDKFSGDKGQSSGAQPEGQLAVNPQLAGGLKQVVANTAQFGRSVAGNVQNALHPPQPQQVVQPQAPVARLYDTRGLRISAHSSGVPLLVVLPISLVGLLAGAAAIAVRAARAVSPPGPEHGDSGALLDPEVLDAD